MNVQLAWALVHFLWQGLAIAVIVWITLQLLSKASSRYKACAGALALMALAPVATFLWLTPHITKLSGTRDPVLDTADLPSLATVQTSWLESHATWLLTLWLAGACLLLIKAVAAWLRARRLVTRQLAPLPADISRAAERLAVSLGVKRARFHSSSRVASALVFGWLKPVIVLPAAAIGRLSEAEIEALLAHELAHVMRHDFFVNLLQTFAECALFYHPCVWWVSARMRHERELCCDDVAVAVCRDEVLYSKALLRLEELRMEPALAATGGRLRDRIQRLLNTPETSRISAAPVVALALLIGVSVALLAQNPPPPPEPPAPPPAAAPSPDKAPAPPAPAESPEPPAPPADAGPGLHNGQAPPPPAPPPLPGASADQRGMFEDQRQSLEKKRHEIEIQRHVLEEQRHQIEKQRHEIENQRHDLENQSHAMEGALRKSAADLKGGNEALKQLETQLKALGANATSAQKADMENKLRELQGHLQALAKAQAEQAAAEAGHAQREMALADRESELAQREAVKTAAEAALVDREHAEAEHAFREAETKRLQAERMEPASQAEMDERRKFVMKHCGGEETDRGRTAMQYGKPDQLEVHPGKGEDWRYESRGADRTVMDFHFDANGKLVSRTGSALSPGERERRVKYANDKWAKQGGAASDKGQAYIKYGPPDEIKTGSSGGETWLYKNEAKDHTRMEVTFYGNGKGQWVKKNSSAGSSGSSLSGHFQDAPELR